MVGQVPEGGQQRPEISLNIQERGADPASTYAAVNRDLTSHDVDVNKPVDQDEKIGIGSPQGLFYLLPPSFPFSTANQWVFGRTEAENMASSTTESPRA
ncbi:hypothetical protein Taro_050119 [Colocasia esculenta]|uniref:Uncharacterized protein n=1 Tax=Colocasia esculenta TaxID=4460 RepID=A0A843XCZ3_COLES|nr:hypothetical protein [Colocasia esculenta]